MAYPIFRIAYGATQDIQTDRQMERATNGAVRGRIFYTTPKSIFKFTHDSLSAAELVTFKAFYAANTTSSFTFLWPGDATNYTCMFGEDPKYTPTPYGTLVPVTLLEI